MVSIAATPQLISRLQGCAIAPAGGSARTYAAMLMMLNRANRHTETGPSAHDHRVALAKGRFLWSLCPAGGGVRSVLFGTARHWHRSPQKHTVLSAAQYCAAETRCVYSAVQLAARASSERRWRRAAAVMSDAVRDQHPRAEAAPGGCCLVLAAPQKARSASNTRTHSYTQGLLGLCCCHGR